MEADSSFYLIVGVGILIGYSHEYVQLYGRGAWVGQYDGIRVLL